MALWPALSARQRAFRKIRHQQLSPFLSCDRFRSPCRYFIKPLLRLASFMPNRETLCGPWSHQKPLRMRSDIDRFTADTSTHEQQLCWLISTFWARVRNNVIHKLTALARNNHRVKYYFPAKHSNATLLPIAAISARKTMRRPVGETTNFRRKINGRSNTSDR